MPDNLADLEKEWAVRRRSSILKQTQNIHPDKWQAFYDNVAPIWEEMTGLSDRVGSEVARFVVEHDLAMPGRRVLEVGCGPGACALALAEQGVTVTALDSSAGMIDVLKRRMAQNRIAGISPVTGDWRCFCPEKPHDLAMAGCFPDAFNPEGLARMEDLSRQQCLLVLGDGTEAFPLRREIWDKVMAVPIPVGNFHLAYAAHFLKLSRRSFAVSRLSLPARLDVTRKMAEKYFVAYFGIFGKTGDRVAAAISDTLSRYTIGDRIRMQGEVTLNLLYWHRFPQGPERTGRAS